MKWFRLLLAFLTAVPVSAHGLDEASLIHVQADGPEPLLDRAEALDAEDIRRIADTAYSAVGCALPSDLVTVFEIFLLDRAMTDLGQPVGPDVAREGFFALRLRSTTIRHPEARAVLAVARAFDGVVGADMRAGRLRMTNGLLVVSGCEPTGTLFLLRPYAAQ